MKVCTGTGQHGDHCCWLKGKVCSYLTEVDGMNRCSIRLDYDSWDNTHKDRRYLHDVKPILVERGVKVDCGEFGNDGQCCFAE